MNLFVNYFDHPDPVRRKEIEYCFNKNVENKYIKKIYVVGRNERVTFGSFFEAMSKFPDDVNIIANLDIYFDNTIRQAKDIGPTTCYALTRWENVDGRIVDFRTRHPRVPPQWSQDAWIFRGAPHPDRYHTVNGVDKKKNRRIRIPFALGVPGCDNKIAALLKENRYNVINPSYSIRAIHLHKLDSRNYGDIMILEGIKPNGLVYQTYLK